ncbi:MAG TPA: hypothetical protein VFJ58_30355 [Armatimonadota bacterium]|nr:hypothetical protein [Armatimonadota bacterium]
MKALSGAPACATGAAPVDLDSLTWGDLIEPCPIPPVVCLGDVQDLLRELLGGDASAEAQNRLAEYVERYYIAEAENRRALSMALASLAGGEGRGFILNGLYGSGKSHFLAVIALLAAYPPAWNAFLLSHPEYARYSHHGDAEDTEKSEREKGESEKGEGWRGESEKGESGKVERGRSDRGKVPEKSDRGADEVARSFLVPHTPGAEFPAPALEVPVVGPEPRARALESSFILHPSSFQSPPPAPRALSPLLVVIVALDERRGTCEDLEDVVFEEAERALDMLDGGEGSGLTAASFALRMAEERLFPLYRDQFLIWIGERIGSALTWDEIRASDPAAAAALAAEFARVAGVPLVWQEPRRDRLRRLLEAARDCGRRGVVILLDELSLFLSSKPRDRFHNDISFLQFLGQQGRLYPLWVVAAVQRGVEEVGDIDADTLHKLKDRYVWDLALSMAQLRPVLGRKLIRKRDPEQFGRVIEAIWNENTETTGFDPEELAEIYPLRPIALECLSEASNRFFSKTRSVIQFAIRALSEGRDRPARDLIGPEEVLEQFWFAIAENPELRPTFEACQYYRRSAAEIYPEDPDYALRLAHALAALSLAGLRKPVRELAAAVPPPVSLSAASRTALAQAALEKLRLNGGYVDVSRGEGAGSDVYFFDAGYDLARTVRRRLLAYSAHLDEDDERTLAFAYAAASDASFPLAALDRPCRVELDWLTVRHTAAVERRDLRNWRREDAAAEVEWLADPLQPEAMRLLIGELIDPAAQRDRFLQVIRQLPADRWRAGLAAWLPRPLRESEHRILRDYAAFCLLIEDPTLRTNSVGRQALSRLRSEKCARDQEARQIVRAAYAEGELLAASRSLSGIKDSRTSGRVLGSHGGRLEDAAALAASCLLPEIFPDFVSIAPRRRLSGVNNSGTGRPALAALLNELVLPGSAPIRPGSPIDGLIRDIAAPLGIVTGAEDRYLLTDPPNALQNLCLSLVPEGDATPWKQVAGALAKSQYGLAPDQVDLLLTVMARRGHLIACSAEGVPLPLSPASLPLSAHARRLRRGDMIAAGLRARLERVGVALETPFVESRLPNERTNSDIEDQERLWAKIRDLAASRAGPGMEDSLQALVTELRSSPDRWTACVAVLKDWDRFLGLAEEEAAASAGLRRMLDVLPPEIEERLGDLYRSWQAARRWIVEDGPRLARALRYLNHPALAIPPGSDLENRRDRLRQAIAGGDSILARSTEAVRYAESLLERYRSIYLEWHAREFGEARFAVYRRIAGQPGWRALEQMGRLPLGGDPIHLEIQAVIEAQLARQCSSAGIAAALKRGPVCPSCRLPAGSVIDLIPADAIETRVIEGMQKRLRDMASRLDRLRHHQQRRLEARAAIRPAFEAMTRLLEAAARDEFPAPDALDRLLDDPLVRELRIALLAGEPAERSLGALTTMLDGREIARTDAIRLFTSWLDPESRLGPEEYVRIGE